MLSHGELLVSLDFQIGTCERRAQQNKSFGAILRKVSRRVAGIESAWFQQAPGASEAASLMTDGRQLDSRSMRGVPNMLIGSDFKFLRGTIGHAQNDTIRTGRHLF